MSKKAVNVRLSTSDIILSVEDSKNLPKYVTVVDKDGEFLTEVEIYLIGYEDEDGNECDEDE